MQKLGNWRVQLCGCTRQGLKAIAYPATGVMPHTTAGAETWAPTLAERISAFADLICPETDSQPMQKSVSRDIEYYGITPPVRLPNSVRANNSVLHCGRTRSLRTNLRKLLKWLHGFEFAKYHFTKKKNGLHSKQIILNECGY